MEMRECVREREERSVCFTLKAALISMNELKVVR